MIKVINPIPNRSKRILVDGGFAATILFENSSSSSSGTASVPLQHAHYWVVEFQSQNSGYKITRRCPYLCQVSTSFPPSLAPARCPSRGIHPSASLHSAPLDPLAPLESSLTDSESDSESVSASAAAALFFAPSKSFPASSHHRLDNLAPGHRLYRSHRSRIGHIAIYCDTLFFLLVVDFLISPKPDSTIASSNGGQAQLPHPPSPRLPPGEPPRNPVLEAIQGPLHPRGKHLNLCPKQQQFLRHRFVKMPRHLQIRPLPAQYPR